MLSLSFTLYLAGYLLNTFSNLWSNAFDSSSYIRALSLVMHRPFKTNLHKELQNSFSKPYALSLYITLMLNLTFKRFGCANILISDQGREFVNSINDELENLLVTEHRMTSVYHPQTNGLVEKFNHTVQSCLLKVVNEHQNDWDDYLDPF